LRLLYEIATLPLVARNDTVKGFNAFVLVFYEWFYRTRDTDTVTFLKE